MASADSARRNCATPIETVMLPISLPVARRVRLRFGNAAANALGDRRAGLEIGARKHRDQFLAAVAGCEIDFANTFLQDLGDQPKHLVADLMAVIVVEFLEVIDVDQEDAERLVLLHRRRSGRGGGIHPSSAGWRARSAHRCWSVARPPSASRGCCPVPPRWRRNLPPALTARAVAFDNSSTSFAMIGRGSADAGGFGRHFAERLDVGLVVGDGGVQELLGAWRSGRSTDREDQPSGSGPECGVM